MINIVVKESKQNTIDAYSLFASFPYNEKIVDVIRECPIRYWNKEDKTWEVPIKKLSYLVENLSDFDFDISGNFYQVLNNTSVEIPAEFEYKTKPYEHQKEGFMYGLEHDKWLLCDEQGLGKTKQVIDIAVAKKLQKGYKHCLIICGVNGLKWNWLNEIHTHSNEDGWILGQRTNKNGKLTIKGNAEKLQDLKNIDNINTYFLITNVETLRNKDIVDELCKIDIGIIAADEIHKMKNAASQQGKGFLRLNADCKIAMTGTPLMNNPLDLYTIFRWLGYESHSEYSFKKHYCTYGGYGGYEIIGYKNLDELREKLDNIMLRRLKAEVLDLPEKTHITEYVEMTPKQKQIYDEVTADIKMNIDNIKMANNPLAELIRMRQATGYTGILSSKIQESSKLDRMEELVEEAIENGKQVVIFSNWTQITNAVCDRLERYMPLQITGETPDGLRMINQEEFQKGNCKIMIGTIGAMGTGLNLYAGSVMIFMDEPWNRANKEQAEDRCHRIGQTNNLTIYTLVCHGTIDERINELVEQKGAMSDALVDGKINTDKGALLNYLLS